MCRGFGLAKGSPDRVDVKEPRCNAWTCEDCAPLRQRILIAQVYAGNPTKFLTLTCRWVEGMNPVETCDRMMKAWAKLLKRLRRFHKGSEVEAFWVLEATKRGAPHLHIALRMPFTHWRIIRGWWKELTGWTATHIKDAREFTEVARYVAKYLGKEPHHFGTHRRYSRTRGYLIGWTQREKEMAIFGEDRWHRLDRPLDEYKHWLVSQGHFPEFIDRWHSRWWKLGHWPQHAQPPPCYGAGCMDTSPHYRASNTHSSAPAAQAAV